MGFVATTPSGRLEGDDRGRVLVFRGIPYARPPTGPLRFRAPEPVKPWSEVRPALRFAPAAPQSPPVMLLVRRLVGGGDAQSQDCLYLNVHTPAADGRRRPVLVWIHGGAFVLGSGSTWIYAGEHLAARGDAVVVTIHYRLGALANLLHPDLRARDDAVVPNLSLHDQIAALRWVRDHIESLGGDPENVTVLGESAGGMSVGTLLGTPAARGLFHKAVCQSGAAHNVSSAAQAQEVAEVFLGELGVSTTDTATLREIGVSRILEAQRIATQKLGIALGVLPWQPSVDGDLLPAHPLDAIARGASVEVPLLVGTNRDEWRLFMLGDRKGRGLDEAGLRRRMARTLPGDADAAFEAYSGLDRGLTTPRMLWEAFQSDRIFHYPAMRLSELRAAHGAESFQYCFAWQPPLLGSRVGACHGIEIPFVFGTLRDARLRALLGLTRAARELSRRMQDAWLAFARSGRPQTDDLPDWPAYDPDEREGRAAMYLGTSPGLGPAPAADVYRFWERHRPPQLREPAA